MSKVEISLSKKQARLLGKVLTAKKGQPTPQDEASKIAHGLDSTGSWGSADFADSMGVLRKFKTRDKVDFVDALLAEFTSIR